MSASPGMRPQEEETLYTDQETLYKDQYVSLTREGHEMILESTTWCTMSNRIITSVLLVASAVISAALWRNFMQGGPKILLLIAIWTLLIAFAARMDFAGSLFPRRTIFDFDTRTFTFSSIPGFDRTYPFSRIEAIDIVDFGPYGDGVLGLTISGKSRRLDLHGIVGDKSNPVAAKSDRMALAGAMAKLLDRPVRVMYRWNRLR